MRSGDNEFELLSDGTFTLDPGALFGIVPRPFWSKAFEENENHRVTLALNIPLIITKDWSALIDSGIGSDFDEKFQKIYEVKKEANLTEQVSILENPEKIDLIVHSHLHFDHMGHSVNSLDKKSAFKNATLVAQEEEFKNLRYPNELTRSSYLKNIKIDSSRKKKVSGSVRIREGLRVILSGGHTSGHQVVLFEAGSIKLMYFGDLIPTAFHLKLPYITAIDTYPLDTLEMKRRLIQKAIKGKYICVFNHDTKVKAAYLSGEVNNVKVEPIEI